MSKPKHDSIYRVARQLINTAVQNTASEQPLDKEAIHELRVLSKKLRALLGLYRPGVERSIIEPIEQQLKQFAASYAGVRDADVLLDTLATIVNQHGDPQSEAAALLRGYLAEQRSGTSGAAPDDPDKVLKTIKKSWKQRLVVSTAAAFNDGLEYSYKKARKLAAQASSSADDDDYHRCRKWVKYHMYQINLASTDADQAGSKKAAKKARQQLKQLADNLGTLHDCCVLEKRLAAINSDASSSRELCRASKQVSSWIKEHKAADKQRCNTLFSQLFKQKRCPLLP